ITSIPASRSALAMIFAPRSWPSRPGLAITTRVLPATMQVYEGDRFDPRPPMKVTVVGCSPAWPNAGGAQSGYLVPGVWGRMYGLGRELETPELWVQPGGRAALEDFGERLGMRDMFERTFS